MFSLEVHEIRCNLYRFDHNLFTSSAGMCINYVIQNVHHSRLTLAALISAAAGPSGTYTAYCRESARAKFAHPAIVHVRKLIVTERNCAYPRVITYGIVSMRRSLS